jgi:hypothetical protein
MVVAGWLVVQLQHDRARAEAPRAPPPLVASASVEPTPRDSADAGPEPTPEPVAGAGGEPDDDLLALGDTDAGLASPDGGAPPDLAEAPKTVRFAVVLVQYAGAQGARKGARGRDEALALARELAEVARRDFAEAVKRGDPGSTEDAGRMFRGVLEPAAELGLFSLQKDQVSDPVDTPRGFWIVKRLD